MFNFTQVPEKVRVGLLHCGSGYRHLLQLAETIFDQAHDWPQGVLAATNLASDILLTIWEENPLDVGLAKNILLLNKQKQFLDTKQHHVLEYCAKMPTPDQKTIEQILSQQNTTDPSKYQSILHHAVKNSPDQFFALSQSTYFALKENSLLWLRRVLDSATSLPLPLRHVFQADIHFALGDYASANIEYSKALINIPCITWNIRRAECLFRLGRHDEAVNLWIAAHESRPWQINTLLRLTDILAGRDKTEGPFPQGRGAILLYTWNKAADMDATLASLAETELEGQGGSAQIFALDNGSTDETPFVYKKWAEYFAGRMNVVTVPVNMGAPVARNWLLSLPEVRQADWAAYLDDDVSIPKFWLRQLWAGLQAYPKANVCGGHAVDYDAPRQQQWTDMQIVVPTDVAWANRSPLSSKFDFTNPHEQCFDFGQFTYMRPASTVIGCCHMFNKKALETLNGGRNAFDVRFSPSQSDDVDLDLRSVLKDSSPVFQGHLLVRHKRISGYRKQPNLRSETSAVCNWYKLQGSYTEEEVAQMADIGRKTLLQDVLERQELMHDAISSRESKVKSIASAPKTSTQTSPNLSEIQPQYKLSVVIPTCNRITTLKRCLKALESQSLAASDFEVVVIDDASEDDTQSFLKSYAPPFAFQSFQQSKRGAPARARNRGIKLAQSDLILFLNDDAILEPGGLAAHLQGHESVTSPISVLGNFHMPTDFIHSLWGYTLEHSDLLFGYVHMRPGKLYTADHYYTCNISTPRSVLEKVGLFDESFTGMWWGAEDIDMGLRMMALNPPVSILYQAGCAAEHDHDLHTQDFKRMFMVRGGGAVRMFTKNSKSQPHYNAIQSEHVAFWRALPESCQEALQSFQVALQQTEKINLSVCTHHSFTESDFSEVTALGHSLWTLGEKSLCAVLDTYTQKAKKVIELAALSEQEPDKIVRAFYPVCLFARWLYDTMGVCATPDIEAFIKSRSQDTFEQQPVPKPALVDDLSVILQTITMVRKNLGHDRSLVQELQFDVAKVCTQNMQALVQGRVPDQWEEEDIRKYLDAITILLSFIDSKVLLHPDVAVDIKTLAALLRSKASTGSYSTSKSILLPAIVDEIAPDAKECAIVFTLPHESQCKILSGNSILNPNSSKTMRCFCKGVELCLVERFWIPLDGKDPISCTINDQNVPLAYGRKSAEKVLPAQIKEELLPPPSKLSPAIRELDRAARTPNALKRFADCWLFMDRVDRADDNAEHLYRWILNNPEKCKNKPERFYFVLDRNSRDWERLSREGFALLPYGSQVHHEALCNASWLISSHFDDAVVDALGTRIPTGWPRYKYAFLQHGVIKNNMSKILNPISLDLLIATAKPEYDSLIANDYKFTPREVSLSGCPRHDELLKKAETIQPGKNILVCPTWRNNLRLAPPGYKPFVAGEAEQFVGSDYLKGWSAFLSSVKLKNAAQQHGYELVLLVHPEIGRFLDLFPSLTWWKIMRNSDTDSIQDMLIKCSALVTDYSSLLTEASLIRKSVYYYNFFEHNSFFDNHICTKGYFDYDQDGFGPIMTDHVILVDQLVHGIKNDFKIESQYIKRQENFFKFTDGNNCKRVYHAICER